MVQRRQREASEAVEGIATGVSLLPQTGEFQRAVSLLWDLVRSGLVEVRAYRRSPLHAGFSSNTELNVRVTGDADGGGPARVVRRS